MKSVCASLLVVFFVILVGCKQQPPQFTDAEKETVKKEVKEQFNQLVSILNQKNAEEWSKFYSKDEFISAFISTDYYSDRTAWVDSITKYFSMRESQKVEAVDVRVNALAANLALLTSEEHGYMIMKDGKNIKSKHVYTIVWKKKQTGWKILHSHESWIDIPVR
jgi:ketosteroid isomerase-like protein